MSDVKKSMGIAMGAEERALVERIRAALVAQESDNGGSRLIAHNAGDLNRIDRVTASSFGMDINRSYCRNMFVELDKHIQMLQAASLYFQSEP